jgi:prepilin-type N-terminal cleavage/methylation domain-containing protein
MVKASTLINTGAKNEGGFTLIEVVIALAIFSVGILAVFSMQFTSIGGNALARGVTENVTAASGKVEELMAANYDDLEPGPGGPELGSVSKKLL